MLTIGNKHLRKRYIYPNNVVDVYTEHNHIWPYITNVVTSPWVVSLSVSPTIVPASGGVVTLTYSAERTITTTWVHYDGTSSNYYTTYETETAVASVTSTIGSISGNKLTIPENTSTTSRDIKVTATYGGSSKTVTITQEAAAESEPTITGYGEWQLTVTANPTSVSSAGGNSTITAECKRSVNWSNGNTTTEYSNSNITLSTNYGTLNNTSVSSNNGTSVLTINASTVAQSNVATITANCLGKTATCTVTQTAGNYIMQKTSTDTSTEITFSGGTTSAAGHDYIYCYSTKDGVKQSVTAASDSDWLTVEENNDMSLDGANYNFKFTQTENKGSSSRTGRITLTQAESGKTVVWIITQEAPEQDVPDWSDWELEIYRDGDNLQEWYIDSSEQTITFVIKCERYDKNGIEDVEYYPTDTVSGFDMNISCTNGGTTSHDLVNYNDLSKTTLTVTIPAFDENSDAYNSTTGVCSYGLSVDSNTTNHGGMPAMLDSVTIIQSAPA